jgi:hypothetical protein
VFVGDSRANNFDTYSQPQDLNIHYIIQRGATVARYYNLLRNSNKCMK